MKDGIVIKTHELNVEKGVYVVTIEDNGELIVNAKNIGCETTLDANGTAVFDAVESLERIKNIVASQRAAKTTANVNVDIGYIKKTYLAKDNYSFYLMKLINQ